MIAELQDLGWMNSWKQEPEIIKKCHNLGHIIIDIDMGSPYRGTEHRVSCKECNYFYKYDSSD